MHCVYYDLFSLIPKVVGLARVRGGGCCNCAILQVSKLAKLDGSFSLILQCSSFGGFGTNNRAAEVTSRDVISDVG